MANTKQLKLLKQGVDVWNGWLLKHIDAKVDLSAANLSQIDLHEAILDAADFTGADLRGVNLGGVNLSLADFRGADLSGANLKEADLLGANLGGANLKKADLREAILEDAKLIGADLRGANLREAYLKHARLEHANLTGADLCNAIWGYAADLDGAYLGEANLTGANLEGANLHAADLYCTNARYANLSGANLRMANLSFADLRGADLTGVNLEGATLVHTKVHKAKISGSWVYGISVWDLEGKFEEQKDLIVTARGARSITVDSIKVAQFFYLLLDNKEIRDVIDTLTSRTVLILGRFTPERKKVLDALRDKLREYNLLPIVFDFKRPRNKDFTETIKTLAGLCYFVIADITSPKSSPLELQATVPDYQIPVVPILQEGERPFAMMADLQNKYSWVLDTLSYSSIDELIEVMKPAIIDRVIRKHNELRRIKAREPKIRSVKDFMSGKAKRKSSKSGRSKRS